MKRSLCGFTVLLSLFLGQSCQKDDPSSVTQNSYPAIAETFGSAINPNNFANYANQPLPNYITKDNTGANPISNEVATLGRVLFYDKKLSVNNQISCASCHKQAYAFGDTATLSLGFEGERTLVHSMRLVNARFSAEEKFFWNERAANLEAQTIMPIQDHLEMGFSGTNGKPSLADLIIKLDSIPYYQELAQLAFGDDKLNEVRLQMALAQFVRSLQSFDSKYDAGRAQTGSNRGGFPNFTAQENLGKLLFMTPQGNGGTSCSGCHNPPEFDIAFSSGNNGVIGAPGKPNELMLDITRSPTLRDMFNPQGELNGPLMHTGEFKTLRAVIQHYNNIINDDSNNNLDSHLKGSTGNGQQLGLSPEDITAMVAFLKTLGGTTVYTDEKYSDPF